MMTPQVQSMSESPRKAGEGRQNRSVALMELLLPNGEDVDDRSWRDERKVAVSVDKMTVVNGS